MSVVEIRIRTFFSCDDCDLSPSVALTMETSKVPNQDWPTTIGNAVDSLSAMLKDAPVVGLRPMTREEVRDYQKSESEDDPHYVTIASREAGAAN